jgi:hypothetical protein
MLITTRIVNESVKIFPSPSESKGGNCSAADSLTFSDLHSPLVIISSQLLASAFSAILFLFARKNKSCLLSTQKVFPDLSPSLSLPT